MVGLDMETLARETAALTMIIEYLWSIPKLNIMKKTYILCLVCSLLSCSYEKISDFTFPDISIEFYLKASDGTDLLNPENEQALTEKDISIYYLDNIDGDNKVKVDQSVYSISYIDTTHLYRFRTLVNEKTSNNFPIQLLNGGIEVKILLNAA
ncbi:MAG: hypothetical protein PHG27_12960 [Massilibacteroides sp.]|nr:hypothetical protein [Massilibacteroides sp.]MDD4661143.1 hypothetical protein [Massilibacteroides sp.]